MIWNCSDLADGFYNEINKGKRYPNHLRFEVNLNYLSSYKMYSISKVIIHILLNNNIYVLKF